MCCKKAADSNGPMKQVASCQIFISPPPSRQIPARRWQRKSYQTQPDTPETTTNRSVGPDLTWTARPMRQTHVLTITAPSPAEAVQTTMKMVCRTPATNARIFPAKKHGRAARTPTATDCPTTKTVARRFGAHQPIKVANPLTATKTDPR